MKFFLMSALCVVLACGCETYQAQPLSPLAVDAALAVPSRSEILDRARALHNPLLRLNALTPAGPVTPAGAAVMAVVLNPELRAQADQAPVARGQLLQAGLLPNPALTYSLDVPFGSNSRGEASGYGLGLDWELTSLITHSTKVEAAQDASRQVDLDLVYRQWQVAQAARLPAYDVIALRQQEADAAALVDQLSNIAARADEALRRHDITLTDASAARAAAQDARVALAATQRDRRDAEFSLRQAVGLPADAPLDLTTDITLPTALQVPDCTQLLQQVQHHRFDLLALAVGYQSQDASLRVAILQQFPKISLGISNTRDYGNFLTLGPALSIDLPIFDHNQGNIAIENATRGQLYDEYIARVFAARSDIVRAVALIGSLHVVITQQDLQVKSLRALVAADQKALSSGNIDVATFYTASISLAQKQLDLTKLKQDLVHALINLELAAGVSLEDLPDPAVEKLP